MHDDSPLLMILFGSRATGHSRVNSDWDVAVSGDHRLALEELSRATEEVARILGANEDTVDLIDLWTASPLLQYFVSKEGKLLVGDAFAFTRFKVLAWKRYHDTAKLRRLRSEALQRHVQRIH